MEVGVFVGFPYTQALEEKIDTLREVAEHRLKLQEEGLRLRVLEEEYALLKVLEKEAIDMQKRVMESVAKTASDEVSKGMPAGRRAFLNPVDCEWSVIGRDGERHVWGAMCGTEKTGLMLGLMSAWTRGSPVRVGILDVDEDIIGLSRKGVVDFFSQCAKLVKDGDMTQIIIVYNRPEEVPDSWHKIVRGPIAKTPDEALI